MSSQAEKRMKDDETGEGVARQISRWLRGLGAEFYSPDPTEEEDGLFRSKTTDKEQRKWKNLKRTLRQRFRFIVHCSKIGLKVLGIGQNVGKKD